MLPNFKSIEILEGNITLQKLMIEVLIEVGLSPTIGEEGALLLVDLDSGSADVDERIAFYEEQNKPILVCGLRHSRARAEAGHARTDTQGSEKFAFIERPFSLGTLVMECFSLLGIQPDEVTAPSMVFPDYKTPTVTTLGDEVSDSEQLNKKFSGDDPDSTDDIEVVFDENSSMILEVEELSSILGASLFGNVERRRVDTEEIKSLRLSHAHPKAPRRRSMNQTMPDTPIALAEYSESEELEGLFENSSLLYDQSEDAKRELNVQIRGVARMLAQSWQRIALTARTQDRSDRIERILMAAINKGLRGASEEVQRIPPSSGFAGGLEVLSLIDVLRTIRDRRLRGKLEIAIGESAFVLHLDGAFLDAIELLSGDTDMILLNILQQGGAIDIHVYENLRLRYENDREEFEPLEMYLLSNQVVSATTLKSARAVRSRELFKTMCSLRGGQFAFLDVRPGDGQSWPRDPLRINHDEILLEILREASIDTGDSKATARTRLLMDPARAASFTSKNLTELERSVLLFFRKGETLAEARGRLEKLAGSEVVDRVVNRLKQLELLRRSMPNTSASLPRLDQNIAEPTVVSAIPEGISATERTTSVSQGYEVNIDNSDVDETTANRKDDPTDY